MRASFALAGAAIAAALTASAVFGGCEPQFPSGNTPRPDGDFVLKEEDPCASPPSGMYAFAVSASATDPHRSVAAVEAGPLELYLWLVTTNLGLAAVELDVEREGAELLEPPFTPEAPHLFITWEGSGEIDIAVASCPMGPTLLGTMHLQAVADSVYVNAAAGSESAGAVDCSPCAKLHPFTSLGFRGE